jgi:hypothetical protein
MSNIDIIPLYRHQVQRKLSPVRTKESTKNWEGDGSLEVILSWFEKDNNFEVWRGRGNGKSKAAVVSEIKQLLKDANIDRSTENIRQKMFELIRKFNKAMDWKARSGNGLMGTPEDESRISGNILAIIEPKGGGRSILIMKCPLQKS